MSKKRRTQKDETASEQMWINPRFNMRGPDGNRAWDTRGNLPPESGTRFLELADVALGLKKPDHRKTKAEGAGAHHGVPRPNGVPRPKPE